MIALRTKAKPRAALHLAAASVLAATLLVGCTATTPAEFDHCAERGRQTFDITCFTVLPGGQLLAGGQTAQFGSCFAGIAKGGWRPAVYRSDDRGQTWAGGALPVGAEFAQRSEVRSLTAAADGTVYAAVTKTRTTLSLDEETRGWLLRSGDGGSTWQQVERPAAPAVVSSVALGRSTRLFASICGPAGGVFRTDDGGAHWMFTGLRSAGACQDLLYSDRAGTVIAYGHGEAGAGLYRSVDDGDHWSRLPVRTEYPVPHGVHRFLVGNEHGLIIFNVSLPAVYGETPLYRSRDRGATWEQVHAPVGLPAVALAVDHEARVFLLTEEELRWKPRAVFISSDAGTTWETLPFFPFAPTIHRNFAFGPDGTLYHGVFGVDAAQPVGTFGGEVRRSSDQGRTWEVLKVLPKSGAR